MAFPRQTYRDKIIFQRSASLVAADKMLRALLRSVELGDIHQLGIRLYGMVYIFYVSFIFTGCKEPSPSF